MKVALLQMTSSDSPLENTAVVLDAMDAAAEATCDLLITPEVTNCLSTSRTHQDAVLQEEQNDPLLIAVREKAATIGLPILLGSIALKTQGEKFANRSILIDSSGQISARYDKAHMFDVAVSEEETYRESDRFCPGGVLVTAPICGAVLGLSICYDVRFAYLYRQLAQAGAQLLTVPSAFSPLTGAAHWEVLLRARAIETGSFVVAPAQTGTHPAARGKSRTTYGHSMVVSPWGDVLLDAGSIRGVSIIDLDLKQVEQARKKIPSLTHDRHLTTPL